MRRLAILAALLTIAPLLVPAAGAATPISIAHAGGGIAFTFDAGYVSDTTAASILESHGMRGTFYIASGEMRQGSYYTAYMSAQDIANLSANGHEIASMGVSQIDLTTVGSARLTAELANSQSALQSITGKPVVDLAYPYGSVNDTVAGAAAQYYATGRTISWYVTDFTPTQDAYHLPGFIVRSATSLAEAEYIVDYAAQNNVYVVLSFQHITSNPGTYDWTPSNLDALAAYVQSKGVATTTVSGIGGTPPPPPPPPPAGSGAVVFAFDDGQVDQLDAAQIMQNHGFFATFFIVSNCPNSEVDMDCMSKAQVVGLSQAGHDIESHTVLHHDLTTLSTTQLTNELKNSQATLQSWTGKPVRHLAYPYGSTNPTVEAAAAKYYKTARLYYGNPDPTTLSTIYTQAVGKPMELPGIGVMRATSLARAEAYVDYAVAHNQTVVLTFHDIVSSGPSADDYSWDPANLNALADYVAAHNVTVKTMAQAYG